MPPERSRPRPSVLWVPVVAAGLLAVGLAVWGATHQSLPETPVLGAPATSAPATEAPSSPPAGTTPPPSASPSDQPTGDAEERLGAALEAWREADTGAFTQSSVIPGIGRLRLTGVYEQSTSSAEVTQVFEAEDRDPVEVRFVGTPEGTYLTSPDWQPAIRRCWMRYDARVLAESTGISVANGAESLPANVVALTHARAEGVDPDDPDVLVGTVRLAEAASLFGSTLVNALGDIAPEAPVAARFRLVQGEIASWRISGRSLVSALRREDALAGPNGVLLAAVSSYAVEVEYDGVGATEVDARLPAAGLRMTQAQARSGEGCPASR